MDTSSPDFKTLYTLEESLWKPETRFDLDYMKRILSPDFFEFGRSGRTYTREEALGARTQPINITLPLKNFALHQIDANTVLATYVSEVTFEELEVANRSSLWVKTANGWQLRFHQGTAVRKQ